MPTYHLLKVWRNDNEIVAELPMSRVFGHDCREELTADIQTLANEKAGRIVFDLRAVKSIDGYFFYHVLNLNKDKDPTTDLLVVATDELREILRITGVDVLLNVVETFHRFD